MNRKIGSTRRLTFLAMGLLAPPSAAAAHVKWFSAFSFADKPRTLSELQTPLVFGLIALSVLAMAALVLLDRAIEQRGWLRGIEASLSRHKDQSTLVMRIAVGATMLLTWQADALLVPELKEAALGGAGRAVGWVQFVIALLLLFPQTTPLAGLGLLGLYGVGVARFGFFYMLDYAHYIGVGVYLMLSTVRTLRIRALRLPVLYTSVGFSLCWLALEKLVYPQWGELVIAANPQLALGLPAGFFLTGAAFVEFALGFLLLICLLQRPLALLITLVFFSTTLVFGKTEVIGHTTLHAALIVFLLNGPGTVYKAPITFHSRLPMRVAFAAVNFVLLFALMSALYTASAFSIYQSHLAALPQQTVARANAPTVSAGVKDGLLEVATSLPATAGHAHVYANNRYIGSAHEGVFDLWQLAPGAYRITVALHTRDHEIILVDGEPVAAHVLHVRQ